MLMYFMRSCVLVTTRRQSVGARGTQRVEAEERKEKGMNDYTQKCEWY